MVKRLFGIIRVKFAGIVKQGKEKQLTEIFENRTYVQYTVSVLLLGTKCFEILTKAPYYPMGNHFPQSLYAECDTIYRFTSWKSDPSSKSKAGNIYMYSLLIYLSI